jgi:hypothetical protein
MLAEKLYVTPPPIPSGVNDSSKLLDTPELGGNKPASCACIPYLFDVE